MHDEQMHPMPGGQMMAGPPMQGMEAGPQLPQFPSLDPGIASAILAQIAEMDLQKFAEQQRQAMATAAQEILARLVSPPETVDGPGGPAFGLPGGAEDQGPV